MTDNEFDQLWLIVSMLPGVTKEELDFPDKREDLIFGGNSLIRIFPMGFGDTAPRVFRHMETKPVGMIGWQMNILTPEDKYDDVLRDVLSVYERLRSGESDDT